MLEATIGFSRTGTRESAEAPTFDVRVERTEPAPLKMTPLDKKFLRSLKITVEEEASSPFRHPRGLIAARPANRAIGPSSSSMRRSWLYFATRSVREAEPVLICPQFGGHREVGDGRVLGLAAAVAHHAGVAGAAGQGHAVEGLGEGADLVDLDQHRVARCPSAIPSARIFGLVTKRSSPTSWTFAPSALRELASSPSQSFSPSAVLDGDEGIGLHPLLVHRDHLVRRLRPRPPTS